MNNNQIEPPLPLGTRPCLATCYLYNQGMCEYATRILALEDSEPVIHNHSCIHPEAFSDFVRLHQVDDAQEVLNEYSQRLKKLSS